MEIEGSSMFRLCMKLKEVKRRLKVWAEDQLKKQKEKLECAKADLQN